MGASVLSVGCSGWGDVGSGADELADGGFAYAEGGDVGGCEGECAVWRECVLLTADEGVPVGFGSVG